MFVFDFYRKKQESWKKIAKHERKTHKKMTPHENFMPNDEGRKEERKKQKQKKKTCQTINNSTIHVRFLDGQKRTYELSVATNAEVRADIQGVGRGLFVSQRRWSEGRKEREERTGGSMRLILSI